jgi:hypothetical protein
MFGDVLIVKCGEMPTANCQLSNCQLNHAHACDANPDSADVHALSGHESGHENAICFWKRFRHRVNDHDAHRYVDGNECVRWQYGCANAREKKCLSRQQQAPGEQLKLYEPIGMNREKTNTKGLYPTMAPLRTISGSWLPRCSVLK